jgi:hypothetical protein
MPQLLPGTCAPITLGTRAEPVPAAVLLSFEESAGATKLHAAATTACMPLNVAHVLQMQAYAAGGRNSESCVESSMLGGIMLCQ